MGELAALYAVARAAFVGGSLVPVGGHNVLEPAAVGVPVLFGPHTEHVEAPATALLDSGGAQRVRDADSLRDGWRELMRDDRLHRRMSEAGRAVLAANRGALDRTLELIEALAGRAA